MVLEYLSTKFNTSSITPLSIFSFTLAYLRSVLKLQFDSKETLFQSIYLAQAPECTSIPLYTLSLGCSISWSLFLVSVNTWIFEKYEWLTKKKNEWGHTGWKISHHHTENCPKWLSLVLVFTQNYARGASSVAFGIYVFGLNFHDRMEQNDEKWLLNV